MPFEPHTRVTWSGIFGSALAPIEQWTFGVNFLDSNEELAPFDPGADVAGDLSVAYNDSVKAVVSPLVRLTEVKVAPIGVDGLYRAEPIIHASNIVGSGGGGGVYPTQVSCAVSLVTATRGPRGRGRFYLPHPSALVGDDRQLGTADVNDIASRAGNFLFRCLGALNDAKAGADFAPVVISKYGTFAPVIEVRVGTRLDIIRRRANSIPEVYRQGFLVA